MKGQSDLEDLNDGESVDLSDRPAKRATDSTVGLSQSGLIDLQNVDATCEHGIHAVRWPTPDGASRGTSGGAAARPRYRWDVRRASGRFAWVGHGIRRGPGGDRRPVAPVHGRRTNAKRLGDPVVNLVGEPFAKDHTDGDAESVAGRAGWPH